MKMGQEKSNSRLPLLVAFLLGACITFLLFRLGDVYGFAIPLDTGGGSSSDGRPASPVPVLVPAPPGYRPPTATDEPVLVPAPPSPPRLPTPVNTSIAPVPTTTPPPIRQISALRLKKDIWPKYYNLSLQVFLPGYEMPIPAEHKYKFLGRLIFFFENKKPLKRIVLNQRDLDIHRCNLTTEQGTVLPIKEIKRDNHLEFVTFELSEELPPGTHRLYVESMGQMERNNKGLYLSRHNEFESKSPYVAITQMEPADARAMVPCLDEPEYKAVWKVSVTHPKGTIALGNEAEESIQQEEDEWMLTKFATTPLMSSYLVAIFVGNYSYLEGNTGRGLRVRTYAPYELLDETHWALEVAIKAMDTYEKIYKIPYPLKKLDMIYVADFEAGAMENWGLVTYRESAILYHKTRYRMDNKKYVADVVAHELGHQWFGNLVTTAWWSHLWLNEGWATFTEFVGTETAFNSSIPDYEYYLGNMKTAMDIDKCPDRGRPMVYELENHDAITDIMFNALTYERGSAFLAMLHELLGSDVFDQGVVNYLEKYQYKNTRQVDFFRELDAVVPAEMRGPDGKRLNVTTFGLKYTLQKGFPVVSLVPHNKTHVRLFQQRFRANTNPDKQRFQHSPYGYKWDVPIFIQRGDNGREFYWLPAGRDLFVPKSGNETLVVNADSFVYAVTNYTDSHWKDIGRHLNANHKIYSNKTRTRLMFEVGELFQRGLLSPETVVDTGAYLFQNEQEYLPFATFLKSFRGMEHVYSSQVKEAIAKFLKAGLKARVKEMDIRETASRIVDSESFAKERLPLLLYTVYCEAAPADCQADLAQIFAEDFLSKCQDNQMASECSTVPVEIRTLVYCEGVRSGDDAVAEMIMRMGKFEKRQAEVESLLLATLCSRSKKVVWKSLATLGVKNPTNATSLLVDGGLNAPLVADDILETFYEKKAVHENAASRTGPPRRFRKFGSNVQYETAEKLRKAISKAVDRGQKTMGNIDVERGRQLAAALEKKAQEFGFL